MRRTTYKIGPSREAQGGKLASGCAETLHTSHITAMTSLKVSICALDPIKHHHFLPSTILDKTKFSTCQSPILLRSPWMVSRQFAPDFPPAPMCEACQPRHQTGCIRGEGAEGGMQQMTAMQISEINHITGSVLFWVSILNANIA